MLINMNEYPERWMRRVGLEVAGIDLEMSRAISKAHDYELVESLRRFGTLGFVEQGRMVEAATVILLRETCELLYGTHRHSDRSHEPQLRLGMILELGINSMHEWWRRNEAQWALDQLAAHLERLSGPRGTRIARIIVRACIVADSTEGRCAIQDWAHDNRYADVVASCITPLTGSPKEFILAVWCSAIHVIAGNEPMGQSRINELVSGLYQTHPTEMAEGFLQEVEDKLGDWAKPIFKREADLAIRNWREGQPID